MILRISNKIIFSSYLLINFIQPLKSEVFYKVDTKENKASPIIWLKVSKKKNLLSSTTPYFNSYFGPIPVEKEYSEKNPYSEIVDLNGSKDELIIQSDKQTEKNLYSEMVDLNQSKDELIIQSDKQFERNNVISAEGNVSVFYKGKLLRADKIIFDKSIKKISGEGNITMVFGEQRFKMSKFEYSFKDQKGYLLDVRGLINSDKVISDLSKNFNSSDIQKLDYLLDLQKKEVTHTPDKVNNWIFSTERIDIDGKKWKSNKAIFSNDILQFKQVKVEINSLEAYSLNEELRFRSSLNYIVLDENVSIPFWLGNRAFSKSKQNFDSKSSWAIGYDKLDKDGLFLSRKLNSLNFSDDFIIDLEPQFFIQRSLRGKTKSFVKKGDLITGEKIERNAEFADYFGFESQIQGKVKNWDLEIVNQINSFDPNIISDSLRSKLILSKKINFLDAEWDKSFYGVYRDRVWNGSLGEAEIYRGYGSKLEKKHSWSSNGVTNTQVLSFGLAHLRGEALSSKNLVESLKGNLFYSIDQNIPLSIEKLKSKTIDNSYEYIYQPTKKGLSLNTRIAALYSLYDDGKHQEYIGFGLGPELIFGNFKNKTFDYTRISFLPFYKLKNGESIFKFDQISDKFTLKIGFDQQIFGPIILKSNGTLNLDSDSDDYGEFIDSKISVNWKKRSYDFGIFYQPHNEAGGISFSLYGFK